MVNKEKLYKALKEEFEKKAKMKVAARSWKRYIDPERIQREKARMAEKERRDKEKAEAKAKHKEEVEKNKEERKAIKEDTLTLTIESKPEITMMLDGLYHDEEKGFMNQHQLYEQAHSINKLVTMEHVNGVLQQFGQHTCAPQRPRRHELVDGEAPKRTMPSRCGLSE